MSQYGTYGYSLHLKTYDYILGHYYSGTTLGALDANPEVVVRSKRFRKPTDAHRLDRVPECRHNRGKRLDQGHDAGARQRASAEMWRAREEAGRGRQPPPRRSNQSR